MTRKQTDRNRQTRQEGQTRQTMAASLLGDHPIVKELVFCKLCSQFFEDPRVLPCQHTFCLRCLQAQFQTAHASTRTRLNSLRCPLCYSTAAIPLRGINQFPTDQKVEKIKELVNTSLLSSILKRSTFDSLEGLRRSGKSRPSSWTGNVDVTAMTQDGNLMAKKENGSKVEPTKVYAPKLPETKEAATDTGDDENEGNLIVNNHVEANHVNLEECGIQTDLCDVTKYVGYEVVLADNLDSQSARKRTSNAKINQNGVPLSKRTCPSNNIKDLHHQVSDCDKNHKSMKQDEGSSEISDAEFELNNQQGSSLNLDKEQESIKKETTLNHISRGDKHVDEDHVDSTMADNTEVMENHVDGNLEDTLSAEVQQIEPVYKTPPDIQWKIETEEYNMPTSIAMNSEGTVIVAEYGNSKLQLYESDGTYKVTLDDVKPYALAIGKDDNIVVADRKDKTIRFYDKIGEQIFAWERDCFYWISGIGVTSQGNVVVFDREDVKVGVFTPDGERITQFGHYGDGDSHLCMADFLTVDNHDRILICDSGHHCIKIFDTNGSFLGRFGERGTQEGYLLWPKSVCVDGANNILVTDQKNNRVSMYSPDGVFIQTVVPSYPSPFGMCFRSPNTLGLTNFNLSGSSCVSIYSL